ncbi:MAG: hypothetical protein JXA25_08030 [Anaerolineales bacterium]|nr:hypothetical protein [Anaerolineales bacterium]
MKKQNGKHVLLLVLTTLLIASLACTANLGKNPTPTAEVEKLVRPSATSEPVVPTTAPEPTQEPVQPTQSSSSGSGYGSYTTIYDDFNVLTVDIPSNWADIDGRAWAFDEEQIGASIWAATSIDGLNSNWTTPGLFFNVTNRTDLIGTATQFLEETHGYIVEACTFDGRTPYDDPAFRGSLDRFSNCGGTDSSYVLLVAEPKSGPESYIIDLEVQLATPADEEALTRILDTFNVIGSVVDMSGSASGFRTVTDNYESIQVDIPAEWTDVDGGYWESDGQVIGAMISASADLDAFLGGWNESGMKFSVSDDVVNFFGGYIMMLDLWREDFRTVCEYTGRYDYEDALYEGKYDEYKNCGGPGGPYYMVLSARPIVDPLAYNILVEVQFENDADLDYVTRILDTFVVVGSLP